MRRAPTRHLIATLAVAAALLGGAGSARPQSGERSAGTQEPIPEFTGGDIEQVTVDVVVVDKKGQPVRDLTRANLEAYEDGDRQTITSFDTFEVAAPPEEPLPAPPGEPDRAPAPVPWPPWPPRRP